MVDLENMADESPPFLAQSGRKSAGITFLDSPFFPKTWQTCIPGNKKQWLFIITHKERILSEFSIMIM
jgi:hypothetical protein